MTSDEVKRLHEAIDAVAHGTCSTLTDKGLSYLVHGVQIFQETLKDCLDVEEFAPYADQAMMLHAIETFCFGHCHWGKEANPGEHDFCKSCPLRSFAIGEMERQADIALRPQGVDT